MYATRSERLLSGPGIGATAGAVGTRAREAASVAISARISASRSAFAAAMRRSCFFRSGFGGLGAFFACFFAGRRFAAICAPYLTAGRSQTDRSVRLRRCHPCLPGDRGEERREFLAEPFVRVEVLDLFQVFPVRGPYDLRIVMGDRLPGHRGPSLQDGRGVERRRGPAPRGVDGHGQPQSLTVPLSTTVFFAWACAVMRGRGSGGCPPGVRSRRACAA